MMAGTLHEVLLVCKVYGDSFLLMMISGGLWLYRKAG